MKKVIIAGMLMAMVMMVPVFAEDYDNMAESGAPPADMAGKAAPTIRPTFEPTPQAEERATVLPNREASTEANVPTADVKPSSKSATTTGRPRQSAQDVLRRAAGGLSAGGHRIGSRPSNSGWTKRNWRGWWNGGHKAGLVSRSFIEARDAKSLKEAREYADKAADRAEENANRYTDAKMGEAANNPLLWGVALLALILAAVGLFRNLPRWRRVSYHPSP